MKTLVLGAGVIGTATAYYLARHHGHEVHVLDRQPGPARETSYANGCILHTSETEPWSRPGMPLTVLRWLGREDAPFLPRYGAIPHMWRWGLAFVRNCRPERFHRNALANMRLAHLSLESVREARAETGIAYDHLESGSMKIFSDERTMAQAVAACEALKPHGLDFEAVGARRAVELEPALAPTADDLVGALYYPPDETGDCHKFTAALKDHCERTLGVRFHFDTPVRALERSGDRIVAVQTERGTPMTGDDVVVALASYTPRLLRPLGIRVPIYPVKGLTITMPGAPWPGRPRTPLIDDARMFALTPLGDRLRVAGSAEIAGYDATPSRARCQAIAANAIGRFPELAKCYDPATAAYWAGLRPMTPQGTPCLGRTPIRNLFLNAGHGHLGWTLSMGAARVAAAVVAGREPGIDLTGLTLDGR